jgi:hypothetical protein
MYKTFIVTSCLFSSVYLFSHGLHLMNDALVNTETNKNYKNELLMLNGTMLVMSGFIYIYCLSYSIKLIANNIKIIR